jgi:hypothetical protein
MMMMMQSASISLLKTETFCLFARFDCNINQSTTTMKRRRSGTQRRLFSMMISTTRRRRCFAVSRRRRCRCCFCLSNCRRMTTYLTTTTTKTTTTPFSVPSPQVYQNKALLYEQTNDSYCSKKHYILCRGRAAPCVSSAYCTFSLDLLLLLLLAVVSAFVPTRLMVSRR